MIEIKKWVKPDLTIILPKREGSYSSSSHLRYSLAFQEGLLVINECDEEGNPKGYGGTNKYYSIKLNNDEIEVCNSKFGWIPIYEEIQDKYNEGLAEKVILGEENAIHRTK